MIEVSNISLRTRKTTRGASKSYYCTSVYEIFDDAIHLVKREKKCQEPSFVCCIWRVTMPANASKDNFQNFISTCSTYFKKCT